MVSFVKLHLSTKKVDHLSTNAQQKVQVRVNGAQQQWTKTWRITIGIGAKSTFFKWVSIQELLITLLDSKPVVLYIDHKQQMI